MKQPKDTVTKAPKSESVCEEERILDEDMDNVNGGATTGGAVIIPKRPPFGGRA